MMNTLPSILLSGALLLAALPQPSWAHGDEDHSHDEPAAAAPATSVDAGTARSTGQTEDFEIVVVLNQQAKDDKAPAPATLTIFLDDFATNAPVSNAKVELESGAFKVVAPMQSPGVYTAPAAALAKPGRHALTVSVDTAQAADLLNVTLDTRDATDAASHEHEQDDHGSDGHGTGIFNGAHWPWWVIGIAAVLLALTGALVLTRRRNKRLS